MPWKEVSTMSLREEFVRLASAEGANVRALCRRYGVSPPTAYKWLNRYKRQGRDGLQEGSRQPQSSPGKTPTEVEEAIVALRQRHPAWGARKLRRRLQDQGRTDLPAASTIQAILQRQGLINEAEGLKHRAWQRYEHAAPNDLWQMDFKGHFPLNGGGRCHPLTILDDHSRFAINLTARANEQAATVQADLRSVFRRYGLPRRMLMDNGSPWGGDTRERFTWLTVWLLQIGVGVTHSRPRHPQTAGKEERFHRTLKAELLQWKTWSNLLQCQQAFDGWRSVYNLERPHEALGMRVPATCYTPSLREYPETLPVVEYGPEDQVRKVSIEGDISFRGASIKISKAFRGHRVALRATSVDGEWDVYFGEHRIGRLVVGGSSLAPGGGLAFVRCAHCSEPATES